MTSHNFLNFALLSFLSCENGMARKTGKQKDILDKVSKRKIISDQLHQGDLHLSGCYQPVAGKIVFNILEARNLPRVSLLGAISKYIILCQ